MKPLRIGPIALVAGLAIAAIGLGVYQAWWTIAFAIGGVAVDVFERRGRSGPRSIATGAAVTGAALCAGMGVFALYGSAWGGAIWFAAAFALLATSIVLLLVARRLNAH